MFKEALSNKLPMFATFLASLLLALNLFAVLSPLELLWRVFWKAVLVYVIFKIIGKILSSILYWKIPYIDNIKKIDVKDES